MSQLISKVKLPANLNLGAADLQNIVVEIHRFLDSDPGGAGFKVSIKDVNGNELWSCPQPCPRVLYPTS